MPKTPPPSITSEQAQEIIRRLGILIVLLAPKRPGSEIEVDVTRLAQLTEQAQAMAATIGSEYRR